jgi:hypothetical protein
MNPIGINYAYWSETWDAEPLPLVSRTQLCGFDILEINAQKIIKTGVRIAKTDRRLFASARMVDLRRSMLIRFAKCSSKNLLGRNCRLLAARGDVYAPDPAGSAEGNLFDSECFRSSKIRYCNRFYSGAKKVGRFCSLPKEGEGILLMVTTPFAPKSHEKAALENLTLVLMQSARRELGCC